MTWRPKREGLVLWVAQGGGVGRIPLIPGTFGSLIGLVWFAILIAPRNLWIFGIGACLAVGVSVWICGLAESILHETDPGSVVLDEVAAMPLCFAGWIALEAWNRHQAPGPESFFLDGRWVWTLGIFAAFRIFDVAKPWPVRQSQALPGGWGVTVDDILAAVYVNLCAIAAWAITLYVNRSAALSKGPAAGL